MIRVAIVCTFSNQVIRERVHYSIPWWEKLGKKIIGKTNNHAADLAIWITNAIHEFEKRTNDVDLHVIAPASFIDEDTAFDLNGIHYFIFKDEQKTLLGRLIKVLKLRKNNQFLNNRRRIKTHLNSIQPQLVHMIGAENPWYSLSLLDVPNNIPTILSLQTLLADKAFLKNYPISTERYNYLLSVEKRLLERASYIASGAEKYRNIVHEMYPDAVVLPMSLPVGEEVNNEEEVKQYDFVYFARNISKAVEDAIYSFAIANKENPSIMLDIVGEYSVAEKEKLDKILDDKCIKKCVKFEGLLPTHEDVIKQIRKARFALLPLRVDLISSTIREAMANGLPVLTTDTGELGTQKLNEDVECALVTAIGDYESMAKNMIKIMCDHDLERKLRANGYLKAEKINSNAVVIDEWIKAYYYILSSNC